MERNRVLLDSSVLVSAAYSSRGGSFYIITSLKEKFNFQINKYVLEETLNVFEQKFKNSEELKGRLFSLLGSAGTRVLPNSPKNEVDALENIISSKDAPILAAALKHSNYLMTLDKEFFNEKVVRLAGESGLIIMRPGEFVRKFKL